MSDQVKPVVSASDNLLFLTDEQLLNGIELMYFAYKGFTSDPDEILKEMGYGRAHHRAIHFINRNPGLRVNDLLDILSITKQSLNRVLRQMIQDDLVENKIGDKDRRERHLYLTPLGQALEQKLSEAQRKRMRAAYKNAGPQAVLGFRAVLENLKTVPRGGA